MSTSSVRRLVAGVTVVVLAALCFGVYGARGALAQAGNTVEIRNFQFTPGTWSVPVGTTVTWTNHDQRPHTATARDGSFDTGNLTTGQSKGLRLDKAGTFEYFCAIHPRMVASLTVTEAQQTPSPAAAPAAGAQAGGQAAGQAGTQSQLPATGVAAMNVGNLVGLSVLALTLGIGVRLGLRQRRRS